MPWKGEKDPYKIWLSEIILQQTRVAQGLAYYRKFTSNFPTVHELANASEEKVMKLWEGLGYYSRARNLHAAAKMIVDNFEGQFPNNYIDILSLKGVGPYTAAAIASFAFELPHAVVDGNVYRVLSRFFGIDKPIDNGLGKKHFAKLAQDLLDKNEPAAFNQAIMDFGATLCTPKNPQCDTCPLQKNCVAFAASNVDLFPIKSKKIKKRSRYFFLLVAKSKEYTFIRKRIAKDVWQHLFEFPLIESKEPFSEMAGLQELANALSIEPNNILQHTGIYKQQLTHQKIHAIFIELDAKNALFAGFDDLKSVHWDRISDYSFPKVINCYLSDKSISLIF
ncbi:UNVERIFIED_CONTAM: hypothetical protein GTU68_011688 [Idotea baltica]|nr:hypothetical protein [Idotea baltica]